jgi:hypothetical protein
MARQNTTNPDTDKWALTPQQEAAVDLLAVGTTVTDAATAIDVARQTVSGWLHHHHGFQAALNRRRQELWSSLADRLRALLPKALTVLEREIDEGHAPVTAAVHVLKACALYGVPKPSGPIDAAELDTMDRERETMERERDADRQRRNLFAF